MSNYRFGLAIANHHSTIHGMPSTIVPPADPSWWEGLTPFLTDRYDTPTVEKEAVQAGFLPLFLYWKGEHIFHYMHGERVALRNAFYRRHMPREHPIHTYAIRPDQEGKFFSHNTKGDPFLAYGGDYWMNELCRNPAFWEGLHKAGTRGLFVIEIGCEHSVTFQDYTYELYGIHSSPAWYLIVADLRREEYFSLERVYPRPEDLPASKRDEDVDAEKYLESTLHFYDRYKDHMITEAMNNPYRETITAAELHRPEEPWYVW